MNGIGVQLHNVVAAGLGTELVLAFGDNIPMGQLSVPPDGTRFERPFAVGVGREWEFGRISGVSHSCKDPSRRQTRASP